MGKEQKDWPEGGVGLSRTKARLPISLERGRESEQASSGPEPIREMGCDTSEAVCLCGILLSVYKLISYLCLQLGAWESPNLLLAWPQASLGLTASRVPWWVTWPPLHLWPSCSSKGPACLPATVPPGPGATQTPVEACSGFRLPGAPHLPCHMSVFSATTLTTRESELCITEDTSPHIDTAFLSGHFHTCDYPT